MWDELILELPALVQRFLLSYGTFIQSGLVAALLLVALAVDATRKNR